MMAEVRKDGMAIRAVGRENLISFPHGKDFWQIPNLWKFKGDFHTGYSDQYLLMPKIIFDDWSEE